MNDRPNLFYKHVTVSNDQLNVTVEDLFSYMYPIKFNGEEKLIVLGQKIKFEDEKFLYTVRAISEYYIICTTNQYYTIIDLAFNIRGPGTSWGLGHETDEQIHQSMLALFGRNPEDIDQEVSRRNRVPLKISELRCEDSFALAWKHEAVNFLNFETWQASNGMLIFMQDGKYSLYENTKAGTPISEHKALEEAKIAAQQYFDKYPKKLASLNWKVEKQKEAKV
nr:hypothetical protein [uncultured Acinetobacter sp.]